MQLESRLALGLAEGYRASAVCFRTAASKSLGLALEVPSCKFQQGQECSKEPVDLKPEQLPVAEDERDGVAL